MRTLHIFRRGRRGRAVSRQTPVKNRPGFFVSRAGGGAAATGARVEPQAEAIDNYPVRMFLPIMKIPLPASEGLDLDSSIPLN